MLGINQAGLGARSAEPPAVPDGPFPAATARDLRALLARALTGPGGFSGVQAGQILTMPASTVGDARKAGPEVEPDDSLPPEVPPGFDPPGPRVRPSVVDISARFVSSLRADYGSASLDARSRMVGELADVREWLAGLRPGQVRPRPGPSPGVLDVAK